MIKVVINRTHGGFGLSPDAIMYLINSGSELVRPVPLTEYTGKDTAEAAIIEMSQYRGSSCISMNQSSTDYQCLGGHFYAGIYGAVFNTETKMVYTTEHGSNQISFRAHPDLITMVEALGPAAADSCAHLAIVEIPDEDVTLDNLEIGEYDGVEWIREKSRTWTCTK